MAPTTVKAVRVRPRGSVPPPAPVAEAPVAPADPSAEFAEFVRARLDGPVLRYSQRLALIKEAERRGVGRFEANLIIAKVLYEGGFAQEYELPPKPTRGWVGPVVAFAVVQSAIVAGVWWLVG
jgi:hypothetical protein